MSEGLVFDIKKFAIHDGPGIRTTIFLKGCPLDCWWCHNPEARGAVCEDPRSQKMSLASLMTEIEKDRVFYEESGGGVTLSGGEPLMQAEFVFGVLNRCRGVGIHTTVDTSGYASWAVVEEAGALADLILYDLKIIDEVSHLRYTGVSNQLCFENLAKLAATKANVRIRVPLIPDITDTDQNLQAIARLLEPLENIRSISLLPYNKLSEDKRERWSIESKLPELETQSETEVLQRADLFRARGFEVSTGG